MSDIMQAKALITGGSSGLGAEIARHLAQAGAHVGVGYRQGADRAAALCDRITQAGGTAQPVAVDQTDPQAVTDSIARAVTSLGGLDILINNAGMASGGHGLAPGDIGAFTPAIWDEMAAVNLRGPFLMTRAAAPHLRASAWGRVVNIGSTIGEGPFGADAAYAPSKGAVAALTRYLAAALAPDVQVNCVAPGLMEGTGMSGGAPEAYVDRWRDRAVLGQTTGAADVACHVVAFCQSASTTGQVLVVDGGIHFH